MSDSETQTFSFSASVKQARIFEDIMAECGIITYLEMTSAVIKLFLKAFNAAREGKQIGIYTEGQPPVAIDIPCLKGVRARALSSNAPPPPSKTPPRLTLVKTDKPPST